MKKISSILCFLFGFIIMLNYVDNNYLKKNIYIVKFVVGDWYFFNVMKLI